MSLSIGIIGLPNVGKSTLFNALLKRQAALAANYPFATIEPNVGVVDVPDERISRLVEIVRIDFGLKAGDKEIPEKVIPATVKFYDIAGLVKGASKGEGLGNEFLGHIRETDALVQVVRDFNDENVIRAGAIAPEDDIATVNTELILSDLQLLEKKVSHLESELRADRGDKMQNYASAVRKVFEGLNKGVLAKNLSLSDEETEAVKGLNLLTSKPMIYIYNVDEADLSKYSTQNVGDSTNGKVYISAKIESEIASIQDETERNDFLKELGITESGLNKLIRVGYALLGLETFFTIGPKEVHAWTMPKGSLAPQAAGKIHTDFERGFISAQIINYKDLDRVGSEKKAKTEGLVRLEGKGYTMKDGDCVEFNFSV
jgi:ribosome-binding ATPase